MQFVACKFRSTDTRTYTYHNDGDPVAVGDQVKVADAKSDGWKRVEVVSITDEKPPFPTKPILGKVEEEPAEAKPARDPLDLSDDEITF